MMSLAESGKGVPEHFAMQSGPARNLKRDYLCDLCDLRAAADCLCGGCAPGTASISATRRDA